jgi:replication factor C small subunit
MGKGVLQCLKTYRKGKNMGLRDNLWVYRYRPQTFNNIILNDDIRPKLAKATEEYPNLLLYGTPGIGKGCFTDLLINQDNVDYMWINASDENGIDVFRNKITPFATAMCMKDMKIVVLNEADSLTAGPQGAQKLLRQLMEDTYRICRFILICNYESYIIPEIKSRCQVIKFDNPPKKDIGKLCLKILKAEKVEFVAKDVIDIVQKTYPDVRKCINVLQENTINNVLTGSRIHASEDLFQKIFELSLKGEIEEVREELKSNYVPYPELYEFFYERAGEFKQPGLAILAIGEYLYRDVTMTNKEINFMTMIVDMMYQKVI